MSGAEEEFTRRLFEAFPEWRQFARTERYKPEYSAYLIVEIPAPMRDDVPLELLIRVDGEFTIYFGDYHTHIDPEMDYAGPNTVYDKNGVADGEVLSGAQVALDFVKSIISDDLVIVSYFLDGQYKGSGTISADAPVPRPEFFGNSRYNRIKVRSWTGARNADIDV